ncbi:MAG: hypothetical protein GQ525_05215 [Draconibacterium sp.]|nr:hypothetical protein [Draconibacterium sp.]
MKTKTFFWIGLFIILLFSCEKRTDTSIVEIESQLIADIPILSIVSESSQLKSSSVLNYSFTGSCTFCLKHNEDLKNCQNNILCVKPGNGAILSFEEIMEDDKINTLFLEWGYQNSIGDDYAMQDPIDLLASVNMLKNGQFDINLDEVLFPFIDGLSNYPGCSFMIKLNGNSNFEITNNAELKIPIVVESHSFTPRFTLF